MRVTFWGTRGSLPAPLAAADVRAKIVAALMIARGRTFDSPADIDAAVDDMPFEIAGTFGGNSACVQIDAGGSDIVLCDAGSGLRVFGNRMLAERGGAPQTYHLCMSHLHWDHINGFPFFTPAYIPGNRIVIYGAHAELESAFRRQHGPPSFPIPFDALGAEITFVRIEPGKPFDVAGFSVTATRQRHGGDSFGYRFTQSGKTVVYATDSEHHFASAADAAPFVALFRDADLMIFDAMYSLGDVVSVKEDWGHSSNVVGVELAHQANAKHLVLFHHEPVHDDARLQEILIETRRYAQIIDALPLTISSAYDGLVVEV